VSSQDGAESRSSTQCQITQHDFNSEATTMHANTQLVGDDRDFIPAGTFH
jgi:hypothetical protein